MAIDPVRAALYGRLNHSSITSLATGGIWHQKAPSTAAFPYVVFHKQDGRPLWSMRDHIQWDRWTVKAVDRSSGVPSATRAEGIAAAIKARLFDAELSITGSDHLYLRWESDVDYPEDDDGGLIHHVGAVWVLVSDPT